VLNPSASLDGGFNYPLVTTWIYPGSYTGFGGILNEPQQIRGPFTGSISYWYDSASNSPQCENGRIELQGPYDNFHYLKTHHFTGSISAIPETAANSFIYNQKVT
jgi:hypothetical protein